MIKQPTIDSGCGIACIANIINKSYEQTYDLMSNAACKNSYDDRVTIKQIKRFLSLSNVKFNSGITLNKNHSAILYVRWPYDQRYKHWVIFHDGLFWDPSPYSENPSEIYETKPEYVIEIESTIAIANLDLMGRATETSCPPPKIG